MTSDVHNEPNYMGVFWALLALTLVEVGIVYLPIAKIFVAVALILMALAKAFLVAWYFMHLRSEKLALIVITVIPLALAVDLYIGLLPDLSPILK